MTIELNPGARHPDPGHGSPDGHPPGTESRRKPRTTRDAAVSSAYPDSGSSGVYLRTAGHGGQGRPLGFRAPGSRGFPYRRISSVERTVTVGVNMSETTDRARKRSPVGRTLISDGDALSLYLIEAQGRTSPHSWRLVESGSSLGEINRGPLAQLVELRTFNPQVVGSSPTGPTASPRHHDTKSGGVAFSVRVPTGTLDRCPQRGAERRSGYVTGSTSPVSGNR